MGEFKKRFRQIKKLPDWIYWLPARLLKLIFHCCFRFEIIDPNGYRESARGMIGVAWHNRLLYFAPAFTPEMRKRTVAVVSPSRDGQYVVDFIAQFGIGSLRGSSSKRGAHAQLAAVHAIHEGKVVIFTPDGPRGPRYQLKPGAVHLASVTGALLAPISLNASRYWEVKSWDRFQIPKPGAKITLRIGDGMAIPPLAGAEELEFQRRRVEAALLEITEDTETDLSDKVENNGESR